MKPEKTKEAQISETLRSRLPRVRSHGVPEGYFENLPETVLHRIHSNVPTRSFRYWPALITAGLLCGFIWLKFSNPITYISAPVPRIEISHDELYLELSEHDLQEDELLEILGTEAGSTEEMLMPLDISQDSLQNYLHDITPLH